MNSGRRWIAASGIALLAFVAAALAVGYARRPGPEHVALEYGRALYGMEATAMYALVSADDRRVRSQEAFRQQQPQMRGFAGEVMRQLARFVTAAPVKTSVRDRRATVTLNFRLPNANAPEIATLMHDWDERALDVLPEPERRLITQRLGELHRTGKLPIVEGEETLELIREPAGWRVVMNWAAGVRVHFAAAVGGGAPLRVTMSPEDALVTPGDRVRVTLRAQNVSDREFTTRVGHRIEPVAQASSLALLQCPLFLPLRLAPGQAQEFVSEYLLLKDVATDVRQFAVTYEFPASDS